MSSPPSSSAGHNARIGIILFLIYLAFYAGFILLSAYAQGVMKEPIAWLGGVNFAIAYGMGLILLAMVLAIIYLFAAHADSGSDSDGGSR